MAIETATAKISSGGADADVFDVMQDGFCVLLQGKGFDRLPNSGEFKITLSDGTEYTFGASVATHEVVNGLMAHFRSDNVIKFRIASNRVKIKFPEGAAEE